MLASTSLQFASATICIVKYLHNIFMYYTGIEILGDDKFSSRGILLPKCGRNTTDEYNSKNCCDADFAPHSPPVSESIANTWL